MNRPASRSLLSALGISVLLAGRALGVDSKQVKALLANPPREYTNGPLWVWNDMLTEEQIVDTLRDLAAQGDRQAFVHPRVGLMTPYLGEDWFRLWKVALDEAERLDMNIWVYDENSFPSGPAGGWVVRLMPEARQRQLAVRESAEAPKPDGYLALYRATGDKVEDLTAELRAGEAVPEGPYMVATVQRPGNNSWRGGRSYVDCMYPGVIDKFLEVTLDPYKQRFGDQFGKRLPGSFTDEPRLVVYSGLPWTDDLPDVFQKRRGYSLLEHPPSLFGDVGDWKRVRHNYYQVCNDLFVQRWAKPYYEYCAKNNLEYTGHYWDGGWPEAIRAPDNMALWAWQQRPGMDCLENTPDTMQAANTRTARELSSVANQLGRRARCARPWRRRVGVALEDMKRIGDWLHVLGINTIVEHLSYVSMRGARKRDCPQSFSYHEPWWSDYHAVANYSARLSAVLSQGEQINHILLLEPTTTAWMYNTEKGDHRQLAEIGESFDKLMMAFEAAQIEYDIGSENVIADHGSLERLTAKALHYEKDADGNTVSKDIALECQAFKIGQRSYTTVVLPPFTENLNGKTLDLLEAYANGGGRIVGIGQPPTLVDGKASDRGGRLLPAGEWFAPDSTESILATVKKGAGLQWDSFFWITRANGDRGILYHHRRIIDDGQILFLVNASTEHSSTGSVVCALGMAAVEQWDLETGKAVPYDFTAYNGRPDVHTDFNLPPCGSLLLFLASDSLAPPELDEGKVATLAPSGEPQIHPLEPNVLTLDYVDVIAGGETKQNTFFRQAQLFAFRKNGLRSNPWDSGVQYKDEWIKRKFPADSGFEASYKFTLAGDPPARLAIVIERPDLYTIHCNGQPVSATKGEWWLDKSFGKIDVAKTAKAGENVVTLKAAPFTNFHELESAYLLGDFTLTPAEKGFTVTPDRPLKLGKWNEQGRPFYAAGVAYTEKFNVPAPAGKYGVALGKWYGSVARVSVNGQDCGRIFHAPWECDVTGAIQPGENTVEVTVIGTLKNTLGPHHGDIPLGKSRAGLFLQAPPDGPPPGSQYDSVGYGLFEPFVLRQSQ